MENRTSAIVVDNLTKRFGSFTAVNHISFDVARGEIFGFLGPNGSGKTTTIRMMLGLMTPSEGSVHVLDLKVDGDAGRIRPRVGYMSQRFSLYNDLTVLQNLQFYGAAYGLSGPVLRQRISEALSLAGLEGHTQDTTKELSGGWRQRLALSAAILHQPEVLFLDEPTAGVDPLSRRAFWDLLYRLVAQGITVFVTTHYMDEAEHCHRLAFIQRGNLIAYGTAGDIKARVMRGQVLEVETSDPPGSLKLLRDLKARRVLPLQEVELYGALIHLVAPDIARQEALLKSELKKAGIGLRSMSVIEPSLEDVFISAMKA